jgi:hypothetical protein
MDLFKDVKVALPESKHPIESKSKGRREKQQPMVIEFHDPLVCERVKIQCDKCKIVYSVIAKENNNYGFCGKCMGKIFTEVEGSRRVF